jgi:virulence factor Mce-like protein
MRRRFGVAPIAVGIVVLLAVAFGAWTLYGNLTNKTITAYFDRSVAIYSGSEVRILGVKVGNVKSVTPQGDQVKIVMRVSDDVDIPAEAKAVQINPSVVSDRYIQFTPAYSGGPKMRDGAVIPRGRTATPVEVDQLYSSIKQLSDALGPNGANKNGAVTDLVNTAAANLAGNGQALNTSITNLAKAARYFGNVRGDLFDTVKNLQVFVSELAANDQQVRTFNSQLASLATFLAEERADLGRALNLLSIALGDIAQFIADNRGLVETNANSLQALTKTLSDQRDALAKALPIIPLTLSNLVNAHNAESGTLDMRADLPDLQDPNALWCRLIDFGKFLPGNPGADKLAHDMEPLISACYSNEQQLTNSLKAATPGLILPFGILSAENIQRNAVPGTVPGIPSHRVAPSAAPGQGGDN